VSLKDLGGRLNPAPGWKFRTAVLEQDLVLTPDNGNVKITQDELGNTYDRVGGAYSNSSGTSSTVERPFDGHGRDAGAAPRAAPRRRRRNGLTPSSSTQRRAASARSP
jgi:hypothetical protein